MKFLILGIVLLTFFKPIFGSWLFIIIVALMEIGIALISLSKIKVKNDNNKYTLKEIEMIERYRLFFQYPFASRELSSTFSAVQLAIFPLVPWLIIKGLFIQAIVIGINSFVATQLSVILNPQFFLHDNLDKGKIKKPEYITQFTEDMNAIDSALKKWWA